jgi:hypothetical protein
MDQKDFTKTIKSTSKVDHEGGEDSILEQERNIENSIGDDDERNSPEFRVSV